MTTPFPFVAGQVLTAAQLNSISELPTRTLTATGNAVAADRYSRVILNGSSISYTVNSATFDVGEVVHLYNINSTAATIAAGTGGVTINAAAGLTLAQYQAATLYAVSATSFILWKTDVTATGPGLVYITGASFSGVTSVSAPNNTFTSTYRNYLILANFTAVASSMSFRMRMRASGTDTTTNYFTMMNGVTSNGAGSGSTANNINFWYLGDMLAAGANVSSVAITLFAPQVAVATSGTILVQGEDTAVGAIGRAGGLMMNVTTQFDSFTLLNTATANMTGNYRVYGYADS